MTEQTYMRLLFWQPSLNWTWDETRLKLSNCWGVTDHTMDSFAVIHRCCKLLDRPVVFFFFSISSAYAEFLPPLWKQKGTKQIHGESGKLSCLEWLKSKLPSTLKLIYSNTTSENLATSAVLISTSNKHVAFESDKENVLLLKQKKLLITYNYHDTILNFEFKNQSAARTQILPWKAHLHRLFPSVRGRGPVQTNNQMFDSFHYQRCVWASTGYQNMTSYNPHINSRYHTLEFKTVIVQSNQN